MENVPIDLFPVDLVENLMPAQRVNVHGNIRHPRLAESVSRLTDALAVVAHRVVPARNEEYGQLLAHGSKIKVFGTEIPHSVRAKEISAEGKSIFAHDPGGKVAEGYKNLTKEVLKLEKQREKNRAGLGR